ncbi:MAG: long-chain fatty acid--CoA ligase [Thermoanaerobaculia bacterium]|nr:long-chain fatty acid--CoA ligase [Thermoanaerobaculia bacterium]
MLNLAVMLEHSARRRPERTAVVFADHRLSYARIDAAANQVAAGLVELGIEPGDKVALTCPNLPYFPIAYYGILKAGAVVVPLNVLFKRREVAYHLEDSDAKAYFCFEGTDELPMGREGKEGFEAVESCENLFVVTADPAAESPFEGAPTLGSLMAGREPTFPTVATAAEDPAVILYTSGTTGRPKGAELTHSNMVLNALCNRDMIRATHEDVGLAVLPLFHSFGQTCVLNAGFCAGMTVVMLPRFEPGAVFDVMEREKITVFAGVPTMYWGLLNAPEADDHDLDRIERTLRIAVSGGASLPVKVLEEFESRFKVPILEGYGLSETSPVASFNQLDQERKPGSIGTPIWGVEMAVVDENDEPVPPGERGEIVIRGHNIMRGYYQRPEANAEVMRNGWFHSGDVGTMDEDGYFYVVDRTKDMVLRGGFNVYPREVEEVLMSHEEISLAAVVGVPDDKLGEEIKAFVVLKPGSELGAEEIVAWSKENIAAYKYPRLVEIRDDLPMTATGKILKKELRQE